MKSNVYANRAHIVKKFLESGCTQAEFAEKCGINLNLLSRILNGYVPLSYGTATRIVRLCGIDAVLIEKPPEFDTDTATGRALKAGYDACGGNLAMKVY